MQKIPWRTLAQQLKKYQGNQLKEKIIDTLLRKGYNYEHIKELIYKEGALNDE